MVISKLKFTKYKCFNCNQKNNFNRTIYEKKFLKNIFRINLCKKCNCEFTNKIPANSFTWSEIYKYGGSDQKKDTKHKFDFLVNFFHKLRIFQVKKIEKIVFLNIKKKKLNILDYGVGDGYLINYFSKNQNRLFASDINLQKPTYLKKNIKYLNYKMLEKKKIKFDIILLRHVLEHCPNPKRYIKNLSKKISKDGTIYVEIPNHSIKSNIFLKIFRNNYAQLCLPHHINHFNKENFTKAFNKDFKLTFHSMNIPILGTSIQNMLKFKKELRFSILNIILFPLQILISIFTRSDVALGIILKKR